MSHRDTNPAGNSRGVSETPETNHKVPPASYAFGSSILDLGRACLFRNGQEIRLRPKSFQVLSYFVGNAGRLITKEELIRAAWPDSFVTDDSLVQCVKEIRRALDDNSQTLLKTVPRRGYVFDGDVIKNEERSSSKGLTVEGHSAFARPRPLPARRAVLWIVGILLTSAAILGAVVLRPSNTPPVWRAVPLTTYPGLERNPALSPDGNTLAFTWNGPAQDNFDIYVQSVGSGQLQRLTTDPVHDTSPAWSPDGLKIAFLRRVDSSRSQLVLIPASGGPEHILTEVHIPLQGGNFDSALSMNLAWSPDGRWLAVTHREEGDAGNGLYLVSVATGEKRALSEAVSGERDKDPAFSPLGPALAFSRVGGADRGIYVLPLSKDYVPSGPARRITPQTEAATHPVWTSDGHRIVFTDRSELRIIDPWNSGAADSVSLNSSTPIAELSLSRHLVYSQDAFDPNIWRAEIPSARNSAPSSPHLLIASTRMDNSAKYSPDGKSIAFRSDRSGTSEIWVSHADGSNPVQLTSFGPPGIMWPSWSPDGQRLLFHARREGHADLFSVAATGGPAKRLTTEPSDDILASYSRDGLWIYFDSNRSGRNEIWKIPADGGRATQITVDGGSMPIESPDRKNLFYARSGSETAIWKIPVEGGKAVQVTGPITKDIAFAVSEKGIYYATPPESPTRQLIRFLDFSTGESRPIVVTDREIGVGMSLSLDERFLIFPQRDQAGSDLMLIKNFTLP